MICPLCGAEGVGRLGHRHPDQFGVSNVFNAPRTCPGVATRAERVRYAKRADAAIEERERRVVSRFLVSECLSHRLGRDVSVGEDGKVREWRAKVRLDAGSTAWLRRLRAHVATMTYEEIERSRCPKYGPRARGPRGEIRRAFFR